MRPFHPVNPSKQEAQTPWIESRKFDPVKIYGDYIALDFIEVKEDTVWSYVACERCEPCQHCGARQGHDNCIVVAVDGACRGNGLPDARASIGVFFGQTNNYNLSLMLPGDIVTNQMGGVIGSCALGQVQEIEKLGVIGTEVTRSLAKAVFKTDSECVVKGMTDWVFKWERNGWRTSRGESVTNQVLFQRLVALVSNLNALGVEVLFWHVLREHNEDADELANLAFE